MLGVDSLFRPEHVLFVLVFWVILTCARTRSFSDKTSGRSERGNLKAGKRGKDIALSSWSFVTKEEGKAQTWDASNMVFEECTTTPKCAMRERR